MDYSNLLYGAYGYPLSESDEELRRLERASASSNLPNSYFRLMVYKIRHGEPPQEVYTDYLRRLALDFFDLPGANPQHSYATDGSWRVNGPVKGRKDIWSALFDPGFVSHTKTPYFRLTYFLAAKSSMYGIPGHGMIQLVAKGDGTLTMEYPHVRDYVGTYRGGEVPYKSAKMTYLDMLSRFPLEDGE